MNDLIFESMHSRPMMEEHIEEVCVEINKLEANYPSDILQNLINKLMALIKHCDKILLDNEEKSCSLDLSLKETATLVTKLDMERKQREFEMNQSFYIQEAEHDEKLALTNQIKGLNNKLNDYASKCDALTVENVNLQNDVKNIKAQYDMAMERIATKDGAISKLKFELESIKSVHINSNPNSWDRRKWVEDTTIDEYFAAFAECMDDVLFLGPSVTLTIRFATSSTDDDSLQFLSSSTSRFVFLCVSDCSDASKDDSGSHWSLMFIDRSRSTAYHFDSLQPLNKASAQIVATNLGIKSKDIIEVPCIQQKQSFECGIHVLANAKYIANHYCGSNKTNILFLQWINEANHMALNSLPTKISTSPAKHSQNKQKVLSSYPQATSVWVQVPRKNRAIKRNIINKERQGIRQKNRFEILDIQDDNETEVRKEKNINCQVDIDNRSKQTVIKNTLHPRVLLQTLDKEKKISLKKSHRLTVVSDSQGRDLSKFIGNEDQGKYNIYGLCQPGAPLEPIIKSVTRSADFATLSKSDCVVVIGGTNNISQQACSNKDMFLSSFTKYIERQLSVFKHTNLLLATIPYRYDLGADNSINKLIRDTNLMIRNMAFNQPHVNILDLYLLKSCHHTRHGLHINKRGKTHVSREIIKLANALVQDKHSCTETRNNLVPVTSPQINSQYNKKTIDPTIIPKKKTNTEVIEVIEADMTDVFSTFKNNSQVAFANCISRDFGDKRHMCAGVAVKFRKTFGRPKHSDCLSEHLAIQCFDKQASVYGLLTKQKYSDKPLEKDYNIAFNDLTKDFQHRKFKRLICSPLGCVRDQINPKLFVKNIVEFQRMTDAMITIVVQEERATRTLRNGVKHQEFVELLRSCISETQNNTLPPRGSLLHHFPPLKSTSTGPSLSSLMNQSACTGQPSSPSDNFSTQGELSSRDKSSGLTLDNLSSTKQDHSSENQVFLG